MLDLEAPDAPKLRYPNPRHSPVFQALRNLLASSFYAARRLIARPSGRQTWRFRLVRPKPFVQLTDPVLTMRLVHFAGVGAVGDSRPAGTARRPREGLELHPAGLVKRGLALGVRSHGLGS